MGSTENRTPERSSEGLKKRTSSHETRSSKSTNSDKMNYKDLLEIISIKIHDFLERPAIFELRERLTLSSFTIPFFGSIHILFVVFYLIVISILFFRGILSSDIYLKVMIAVFNFTTLILWITGQWFLKESKAVFVGASLAVT